MPLANWSREVNLADDRWPFCGHVLVINFACQQIELRPLARSVEVEQHVEQSWYQLSLWIQAYPDKFYLPRLHTPRARETEGPDQETATEKYEIVQSSLDRRKWSW